VLLFSWLAGFCLQQIGEAQDGRVEKKAEHDKEVLEKQPRGK
jgi:hypothetical protein